VVDVRKQRRPLGAARQLLQRIPRDDVAADQAHRRIAVSALLAQDGTREHRVEPALRAEIDLNLCTDHSVSSSSPTAAQTYSGSAIEYVKI